MMDTCLQPDVYPWIRLAIFIVIIFITAGVFYWIGRSHIRFQAILHGHAFVDSATKKFLWKKPNG